MVPFAVSGPNSSARVISLLSALIPRGMPLEESLLQVVGPFPVAGPAWWINDWHAPRSGGRVHQGLDIFAPAGTPLVAAASGILSQKGVGGLCGIYVEITDPQGIQYFYCHMSAHAPGLQVGQAIQVGQVVGLVGNTGNAINTPSHVHFEFQPGGVPHPPKPWVDRWVRIAEQRALDLVRQMGGEIPILEDPGAAADAFRLTRTFDLAGGTGGASARHTAVILPGLQPGLPALQIAGDTVDQMAWEIDWGGATDAQLEDLVRRYRTQVVSEALAGLGPWPFAERSVSRQATAGDGSD
ncbi:MAG TPA: M23 family metallopeptidase [Actinomycetota bacterium]